MELTYELTGEEQSTPDVVELALREKPSAISLFQPGGLNLILDKITIEAKGALQTCDMSTERGRKAHASFCRKISSAKVRLDDFGKDLISDKKAEISMVDAERKRSRDYLDQLRDDTRKPLTDFENQEKSRVQAHEDAVAEMANMVPADTLDSINAQVETVEKYTARDPQEFKERYGRASQGALLRLAAAAQAIRVRQEEQAELARLQKLEAERQQFEREERIKAQAAAEAKAAAEARALEEAQAAERAAKAVNERIQREKAEAELKAARAEAARLDAIEAAERARLAEETRQRKEAARVEFDRIEAEDARVAAEKRHVEELAAAERKAEVDQKAAIESERRSVAEAKRIEEAATAKREANKKHRAGINRAAVAALVASAGLTEDAAVLVVTAIAHGKVPNVSISY